MKFPEPLESRMYGDPMDILAAKQSRERRQEPPRPAARNTPLPEQPRRWEDGWSAARRNAEALFDGGAPEERRGTVSSARQALEALFVRE